MLKKIKHILGGFKMIKYDRPSLRLGCKIMDKVREQRWIDNIIGGFGWFLTLVIIICLTTCVIKCNNALNKPKEQQQYHELEFYDVDKDGKINCVDQAIITYDWLRTNAPDLYVVLLWNFNPPFSHLFIRIQADPYMLNDATDIELDCAHFIEMKKYWGARYNPYYNRDVTKYYYQIKAGTYTWPILF